MSMFNIILVLIKHFRVITVLIHMNLLGITKSNIAWKFEIVYLLQLL